MTCEAVSSFSLGIYNSCDIVDIGPKEERSIIFDKVIEKRGSQTDQSVTKAFWPSLMSRECITRGGLQSVTTNHKSETIMSAQFVLHLVAYSVIASVVF